LSRALLQWTLRRALPRGARRTVVLTGAAAAVCVLAAVPASAQPAPAPLDRGDRDAVHDVCGAPGPGNAHCHAKLRFGADGTPHASSTPVAGSYGPVDLRSAYALPAAGGAPGSGPVVAVVDAYDNPNVEADLNVYRTQYGLGRCTSASGCFAKLNQRGQAVGGRVKAPAGNVGWGQEIAIDVEMAAAVCPACRIVLVEADSNSFANLAAGVDAAVAAHAVAVSNSYGAGEFNGELTYDAHYRHPGVAVTVSSGDAGYGAEYPASSQYVVAVGGTSLTRTATARGWSETAWSSAGSGCSAYVPQPAWQTTAMTGCATRALSDVSAVADPYTGVAVYDSYGSSRGRNWYVFGGTSVASPIVAAVYALAGNTASADPRSFPYQNATALNDVVGGSNGSCGVAVLCTAGTGWDGPTGLGTPNGTGGF